MLTKPTSDALYFETWILFLLNFKSYYLNKVVVVFSSTGKTYAIFITPYNIPENSTVDGIVLTSSIESDYNLTNVASGYETTYFVMATLTEAVRY